MRTCNMYIQNGHIHDMVILLNWQISNHIQNQNEISDHQSLMRKRGDIEAELMKQ